MTERALELLLLPDRPCLLLDIGCGSGISAPVCFFEKTRDEDYVEIGHGRVIYIYIYTCFFAAAHMCVRKYIYIYTYTCAWTFYDFGLVMLIFHLALRTTFWTSKSANMRVIDS